MIDEIGELAAAVAEVVARVANDTDGTALAWAAKPAGLAIAAGDENSGSVVACAEAAR